MKKIYAFLACTALLFTACSDDDNKAATSYSYLKGTWVETAPTANGHTLKFADTDAVMTRSDGSSDAYNYTVANSKITFTLKSDAAGPNSTHDLEKINASAIKLSNIYIQTMPVGSPTPMTTFVKK